MNKETANSTHTSLLRAKPPRLSINPLLSQIPNPIRIPTPSPHLPLHKLTWTHPPKHRVPPQNLPKKTLKNPKSRPPTHTNPNTPITNTRIIQQRHTYEQTRAYAFKTYAKTYVWRIIHILFTVKYSLSNARSFFRAISKFGGTIKWRGKRNLHISSSAFSVPSMKALMCSCFLKESLLTRPKTCPFFHFCQKV